jgi:NosR/NirI family nitrous oxide reductase transcriptional regulator
MILARCLSRYCAAAALFLCAVVASPAAADMYDPLDTRLTPEVVSGLFPDAALGPVEGDPPLATVWRGGALIGYLFSTHETVRPAGYNGLSFDIIVALSVDGVILGHNMLEEHEPLISDGMIPPENFRRFLSRLDGADIKRMRKIVPEETDGVSGATISAKAMSHAMANAALLVGYLKGIISDSGGLSIDCYAYAERTWPELLADGSIQALHLTNGQVRAAFAAQFGAGAAPEVALGPDDEPFLSLYTALSTPPAIGRNLIGARAFRQAMQASKQGEHQLLVASTGAYKWIPPNPWLVPTFDRVRIVQDGKTIRLAPENFFPARRLAIADHPRFRNAARFRLPPNPDFDPLKTWVLEIRVFGDTNRDRPPRWVGFELPYRIPARYVLGDDTALEDAGFKEPAYVGFGLLRESTLSEWQRTWVEQRWSILGLLALLSAVTTAIVLQGRISRHGRLRAILRNALLAVTLVWLGWIAGAQLTILTVMNYLSLAFNKADWTTVLFEPLMVILAVYVAISLVLWGRGVFCGWLCPFGALQELLNKLARAARLPQPDVPFAVQRRLWLVKYAVAAGVLGLAAYSMSMATTAAEIEPFKTAITLKFQRTWPYLAYAGALLAIGLFVERAFCRFLCPLGAVLALAGKLRQLAPLKRRAECGNPCHLCERHCPIQAIEPSGQINMTECFYCLDCQVVYYDDHLCPPLIATRKRRDRIPVAVPAE